MTEVVARCACGVLHTLPSVTGSSTNGSTGSDAHWELELQKLNRQLLAKEEQLDAAKERLTAATRSNSELSERLRALEAERVSLRREIVDLGSLRDSNFAAPVGDANAMLLARQSTHYVTNISSLLTSVPLNVSEVLVEVQLLSEVLNSLVAGLQQPMKIISGSASARAGGPHFSPTIVRAPPAVKTSSRTASPNAQRLYPLRPPNVTRGGVTGGAANSNGNKELLDMREALIELRVQNADLRSQIEKTTRRRAASADPRPRVWRPPSNAVVGRRL
jgi:hypothetical protein